MIDLLAPCYNKSNLSTLSLAVCPVIDKMFMGLIYIDESYPVEVLEPGVRF